MDSIISGSLINNWSPNFVLLSTPSAVIHLEFNPSGPDVIPLDLELSAVLPRVLSAVSWEEYLMNSLLCSLVSDSDDTFLRNWYLVSDLSLSSVALVSNVDLVFYSVDYNDNVSLSFLNVKLLDFDLALYFFNFNCCPTD